MPKQEVITLVSLAVEALQNDDLTRARLAIEEALRLDSRYAEAHSVYGVILAAKDHSDDALQSFRQAVLIAPTVPRFTYNLAVHYYVRKDFRSAYESAGESLKDDPQCAPAEQLREFIEAQDYDQTVRFDVPRVTRVLSEDQTPGPAHALSFMVGMEKPWKIAGWTFVALGAVAAICNVVYQPLMPPDAESGKEVAFNLSNTMGAKITIFLMAISGILTLMWMLIDVVDRKTRLVWLVPSIACCTCGMHAFPQALYLLMRRD